MTLVEILVVLALVGIAAGAVGLGLGAVAREPGAASEGELLAARMRRASEEALLTGQPVALVWSERGYRFLALGEEGWVPHPVPLLADAKALADGVRLPEAGSFAVTGSALPAEGGPLALRIEDGEGGVAVTWDGATAAVSAPPP